MEPTPAITYRSSGRLGAAWPLVPPVTAIISSILGVVYAYAIFYSGSSYIPILLACAFPAVLGYSVVFGGRLTKCRSLVFLRAMGALAGILGLYVSWVAFEYLVFTEDRGGLGMAPTTLLLTPTLVWDLAQLIAVDGWYTTSLPFGIGDESTTSGAELWAYWGLEALVVVCGTELVAAAMYLERIFCESCELWCTPWNNPLRVKITEETIWLDDLAQGQVQVLESLSPAFAEENPHVLVDVEECGTCRRTAAYRVSLVSFEADEKGEIQQKTNHLTDFLLLNSSSLELLRSYGMQSHSPLTAAEIGEEKELDEL